MIENNDGGIIDTSSVMLIANKIQLYVDNEEKIIDNIKKSLILLDKYYSSQNDKVLEIKKNSLCSALDILLKKKKNYVEYLKYIVNSYIDKEYNIEYSFESNIN